MSTIILTPEEFLAIPSGSTGEYELGANIELGVKSEAPNLDFSGILDGKGYTLSCTFLVEEAGSSPEKSSYGIFGTLSNATIKNLNIKCAVGMSGPTQYRQTGALVGFAEDSVLENVVADVDMSWTTRGTTREIGGLVGSADRCTFINIRCMGNVSRVEGNTGGYVGQGGLFGKVRECHLKNIYSKVDLPRPKYMAFGDYTGGLVGMFYDSVLENFELQCNAINIGRYGGALMGYCNGGDCVVKNGVIELGILRQHYGGTGLLLYSAHGTVSNVALKIEYIESTSGSVNFPVIVSTNYLRVKDNLYFCDGLLRGRKMYTEDEGTLYSRTTDPLVKVPLEDYFKSSTTFDSTLGAIVDDTGQKVFKLKDGKPPHTLIDFYDVPIYLKNETHYFRKSGNIIEEVEIAQAIEDLPSFNQADNLAALTKSDILYLISQNAFLVSDESRVCKSSVGKGIYEVLQRDFKTTIKDYNSATATINTVEVI